MRRRAGDVPQSWALFRPTVRTSPLPKVAVNGVPEFQTMQSAGLPLSPQLIGFVPPCVPSNFPL
jgi:hypothetical protein